MMRWKDQCEEHVCEAFVIKYMEHYNIIVEKHPEGFIVYPLGLNGVVVGEGNSYEEALADVHSAIKFHIETFGNEAFQTDSPVLEAYLVEA